MTKVRGYHERTVTISKPCDQCNGTGTHTFKKLSNLWTPADAAAFKLAPETVLGAPPDALVCVVVPGAQVYHTIVEAIEMASEYGGPIAFDFNGRTIVARASDDPKVLAAAWDATWKREADG